MTTSLPYVSIILWNHVSPSFVDSASSNEHMGVPLALINRVTRRTCCCCWLLVLLLSLLLASTTGDDETTNTILAISSILTWNSKDASLLANVIRRSPDLGEMLDLKVGPSWEVDSSMAPLPMTMIRKDNLDAWKSCNICSAMDGDDDNNEESSERDDSDDDGDDCGNEANLAMLRLWHGDAAMLLETITTVGRDDGIIWNALPLVCSWIMMPPMMIMMNRENADIMNYASYEAVMR